MNNNQTGRQLQLSAMSLYLLAVICFVVSMIMSKPNLTILGAFFMIVGWVLQFIAKKGDKRMEEEAKKAAEAAKAAQAAPAAEPVVEAAAEPAVEEAPVQE